MKNRFSMNPEVLRKGPPKLLLKPTATTRQLRRFIKKKLEKKS
jgi:hypothetical protein